MTELLLCKNKTIHFRSSSNMESLAVPELDVVRMRAALGLVVVQPLHELRIPALLARLAAPRHNAAFRHAALTCRTVKTPIRKS